MNSRWTRAVVASLMARTVSCGARANNLKITSQIAGFQSVHRNLLVTATLDTYADTLESTPTTLFYRVGVE